MRETVASDFQSILQMRSGDEVRERCSVSFLSDTADLSLPRLV